MLHFDQLHKRRDAGYIGVAVAGSLIIFCGFLGLATDVGLLYFDKGRMQAAADSAAVAGAQEVFRGNTASITSAAQTDATSNGYTTGVNGATVTVNNPPVSGTHIGDSNYVEAIVARAEPTFFMNALGISSVNVSARAVAGLESAGTCIYVLEASASNALVIAGNVTVNVPCAIVVNSTDSKALVGNGGACITATEIGVTGNYSAGCYTPTPITGVDPSADPLLSLTPPSAAATCDAAHTNYSISSGTESITAGTYCGGISVANGATLNLGAGTYILKGGGLTVQNSSTQLNGTGVTIYNTCNSGDCSTSTTGYGAIQVKSNSTANLTAPTSGSFNNILMFVDRNAPSGTVVNFSASTFIFTGTLYAKTEEIDFAGSNASTSLTLNIVSRLLSFSGNSALNLNHTFIGGSAIKDVQIVE
jgi:hypothetical protein